MKKSISMIIILLISGLLFSCKEQPEQMTIDSLPKTKEEILSSLGIYKNRITDINETIFIFEPATTQQNFVKDIYLKDDFDYDVPDQFYYKSNDFIPHLDTLFTEIENNLDSFSSFKTGEYIETDPYGGKILFYVQEQSLRIILTSIDENEEEDDQKENDEKATVNSILDICVNPDGSLSYKYIRYSGKIGHEYITYYEINEGKDAIYFKGQGATDVKYLYLDMATLNVTEYLRIPNSLSEYSEYYYYFDNMDNMGYFAFLINDELQSEHISRMNKNTMIFSYTINHEEIKKVDIMWNMTYVNGWETLKIRESSQWHYYVGDYFTAHEQNYFSEDKIYAFVEWGNPKVILHKELLYSEVNDSIISLSLYGMQFEYTQDTQESLETLLSTYIDSISGDLFYGDIKINEEDSHISLIDYFDSQLFIR